MNKKLYLFVGKSASGKTTAVNILELAGNYKSLQSYTTRPPRCENEVGHVFVTDEEFDELENIVAFTEYNDCKYCCTKDQIDEADLYVIDVPGVETLLENYHDDRTIVIFYFDASIRTRIDRMVSRGDCDAEIVSRLYNDEESDWERELKKIVWNYKNNFGRNVEMYSINANQSIEQVLANITGHMNNEVEVEE